MGTIDIDEDRIWIHGTDGQNNRAIHFSKAGKGFVRENEVHLRKNKQSFEVVPNLIKNRNKEAIESYIEKQLLDFNAKDYDGYTLAHVCIEHNQIEILKSVVERGGANLNLKSIGGQTPLSLAVSIGHLEIVEFLLKKQADHSLADAHGYTPLHIR